MTRVPVTITRSRLVPAGFAAWVPLKRTILVQPAVTPSIRLIAHELMHVHQAEHHVWPAAYLAQWARNWFRYRSMPFEVEARKAETEPFYLDWASDALHEYKRAQ